MRAFGSGLLTSFFVLFAMSANAGLVTEDSSTKLDYSPQISSSIETTIPLSNLVSPSMQWSQLEMDSLKAEGFRAGLPYAYSAETAIKSDLIHSFNVAQIEMTYANSNHSFRAITALLIFTAGVAMWAGLTLQRK